ncbi:MAG: aspartate aminotransferase family protein [Halobacteriovoraceae bacterium]|nr:aspartate aminotransferase family protein [Halobacteriovoraceae bacterium]MCB9094119.1 aspartate aminotransferase family protein [Halobacteriovoraceae bacterium]
MSHEKYQIPEKGLDKETILNSIQEMKKNDVDYKKGKNFSLVYYGGEEISEIAKLGYLASISENGLNPTAFPSLKKMENQVVSMVKSLLSNDENTCGLMTSGGTESILMAVKSAREWARKNKKKIKEPEMVVPISVHPAFDKAAYYFGVKIIKAAVNPETYQVDIEDVKRKITKNTILLVGSSPSYPQGVVDPIAELGQLALEHDILCHSDACIGGLTLAFYRLLGIDVPSFDLSVPGVTSLSVDIHKYGYSAKGASVILYRNKELRKHQFFCTTDWTGGIYISPSALGTRPGGAISSAWAVMNFLGIEGYKKIFQSIYETKQEFEKRFNQMPDIKILGKPNASLIAIGSDKINVYILADEMQKKGWAFDKGQNPASIHMTIMYAHRDVIDEFFSDLEVAIEETRKQSTTANSIKDSFMKSMIAVMPNSLLKKVAGGKVSDVGEDLPFTEGASAPIYGLMGPLNKKGALKDVAIELLDSMYNN